MKKVLLYITMLLLAALLSAATAMIGKDWVILLVGGLAVLVLVGMGVLIEENDAPAGTHTVRPKL